MVYRGTASEVAVHRRGSSAGAPTALAGSILNRGTSAGRDRSIHSSSLSSNESLGRLVSVALREAIILADTHQLCNVEDEKEPTLDTN